jgi:hypothetical protein
MARRHAIRDVAHDLDDLQDDISAGDAGIILSRYSIARPGLCLGTIPVCNIPIDLVWHCSARFTCCPVAQAKEIVWNDGGFSDGLPLGALLGRRSYFEPY